MSNSRVPSNRESLDALFTERWMAKDYTAPDPHPERWDNAPFFLGIETCSEALVVAGARTVAGWRGRDGRTWFDAAAQGGNVEIDSVRIARRRRGSAGFSPPTGDRRSRPAIDERPRGRGDAIGGGWSELKLSRPTPSTGVVYSVSLQGG